MFRNKQLHTRFLLLILLLTIFLSFFGGCSTRRQEWEYKVVPLNTSGFDEVSFQERATIFEYQLNELGKDGWECSANFLIFEGYYIWCKRPR